jgi:hypothetical protein
MLEIIKYIEVILLIIIALGITRGVMSADSYWMDYDDTKDE